MKIFNLPDLGEGLAEAEIRSWYVKVGEEVKVDQPLVSMETAKAVVDVPSPYSGKITKLHGAVNDVVQTGAPLITFETNDGASVSEKPKGTVVGSLEESSSKWNESEMIIGTAERTETLKAMPAARVLAQQLNVDLKLVKPTGPRGLITPQDVKKFMESHGQTARGGIQLPEKSESLHGVRRVMAQVMTESHREVAATTIIEDADITNLPAKTDLTVYLLKAMVAAAKVEPALNAWFDGKSVQRKLFTEVNIGLAMDTQEGLFVPVLKDVGKHSENELRKQIDDFKTSIKSRSIAQSDMQGATISLSNFGTITGRYATPVIVPPMVSILGSGRSREVPIIRDGQVKVGRVLPLSLTFDHRAVTGGEATRFLGEVINILQKS